MDNYQGPQRTDSLRPRACPETSDKWPSGQYFQHPCFCSNFRASIWKGYFPAIFAFYGLDGSEERIKKKHNYLKESTCTPINPQDPSDIYLLLPGKSDHRRAQTMRTAKHRYLFRLHIGNVLYFTPGDRFKFEKS
jgi:hypothetical protein